MGNVGRPKFVKRELAILCAVVAVGCGKTTGPLGLDSTHGSATTTDEAPPPRLKALEAAELARDSSRITEADLSDRNVLVRRSAARALARIADERSAKLLVEAVADEDGDVVAWAAYGLGFACPTNDQKSVRALTVRAASWTWQGTSKSHDFDVGRALAQALARCGTRDAETTLRAWLSGPRQLAEAGALGLATLASRHGRIDDASIVALLDAADRLDEPLDHALLAFSHLDAPNDSVRQRLVAVASKALGQAGTRRRFAIRALGLGDSHAVPLLASVLGDAKASVEERAEAARQLVRLGEPGQPALATALVALAPKKANQKTLISANFATLAATLEGLEKVSRESRDILIQLADLPIPKEASAAVRRRAIWLRCRAASLLAGTASLSARLLACDPTEGREGRLAMVEVLDRGRIEGARYRRWKNLAIGSDAVVREAALRLMVTHAEIAQPHEILAAALGSDSSGVVTTAAQILASYPDRASDRDARERAVEGGPLGEGEPTAPRPEVVKALTSALAKATASGATQRQAALIDAAGALQLLSFKPQLGKACASEHVVLRERAQRALRLLGERRRECHGPAKKKSPPLETFQSHRLTLRTDVGDLTIDLDSPLAPQATARVVDLAESGFYDKTVVHRAIPGFIVQFGDRDGDGFGAAKGPPLRCETSPVPFAAHSVGMAISGRDTGSSQLFVSLDRYPHLDGNFTRIGTASGPWDQLVVGDVIRKVSVSKR